MDYTTAVLLTCHNRKTKTLRCLQSLFAAKFPTEEKIKVFLVDDGSTDGTGEAVNEKFPEVNVIQGNGKLFWAGGMRFAYEEAKKWNNFNNYLLLNDDVELWPDFYSKINVTKEFCNKKHRKGGIYSGSTEDKETGVISYGGNILTKGFNHPAFELLKPSDEPQPCHLTNANILYIEKNVVDSIGFFDDTFTHGIADYDFSLRAVKAGFPVYITPGVCGYCKDDHGNNWSNSKSLKQRINYLKSPTGLAYKEYLHYIKRHFPKHVPSIFVKLWGKTFFPSLWKFKKKNTETLN